jgi:ribose transport system permease protein
MAACMMENGANSFAQRVSQPAAAWIRPLGREDTTAVILFGLTALIIFGSRWINPALGTWSMFTSIAILATFVIVVAFGQQTVILIGGLDLSVGAVMTLGAVLMFSTVGGTSSALIWGVPAVLLITAGIGMLNGVGVALLGIPPFVMTLATGIILSSTLLGVTGGAPNGTVSPLLVALFTATWLGIPPIVYLIACLVALGSLMQRRTAFGRMLYAVGTNRDAAYIAGVPVSRVTIFCYTISGAAAGLAGILMTGFSQGATLNSGDNVLIPSIAAVVIGGTSIMGGRGNFLGAAGGVILLTTFSTVITALRIPEGWRMIVYGSVILLALLALQEDFRRFRGRMSRHFQH